jgi:uncharacterized protein GlcG (DUF336 family)
MIKRHAIAVVIGVGSCVCAVPAFADCTNLPQWSSLKGALSGAVSADATGFKLNMWATIVDRDGTVCAVAFNGDSFRDQWLGSRVISAQKANTANDFSLGRSPGRAGFPQGLALSTANLYSQVQPGLSLFGLQHSNPVDTEVAYDGKENLFGSGGDPMTGRRIGGVNVFGGGLSLYRNGQNIGAVGVSGDTSCRDHRVAWLLRHNLSLDQFGAVAGVSGDPQRPDNIVFLQVGETPNGFKHPHCLGDSADGNPADLPAVQ